MLFYFTATGNCLYVAKQFDEKPLSIAQELKKENLNYEAETIGIVAPIYSGELPKIVRRFIEKATFKTDYLYMILTYGKDDTVAGEWSYYFGKTHKVHIDYIHTMEMVDNYLPSFDMNEQMAMDKKIPEQLAVIKEEVAQRKHDIPLPTQFGRDLYEMASRRPTNLTDGSQITVDKERCVGCGICTRVCPIGNFEIKDKKAVRKSNQCEFCLACAQLCPQKAIFTLASDKNREARYINENITLSEIIKANQQ